MPEGQELSGLLNETADFLEANAIEKELLLMLKNYVERTERADRLVGIIKRSGL